MTEHKVKLTADSTCDIGEELISQLDMSIAGLIVTLGDKNYRDLQDVFPQDIYDFVDKNNILPKTAAPSPDDYRQMFAGYSGYESVLHFNISSKMSASYQNAVIAAKDFDNVYIIDSSSLSSGTALLILQADKLRREGLGGLEIKGRIEQLIDKVQASFVIDTLEYLHKGGRCTGMEKLGAAILRLHPMLLICEGEIKVYKKLRGKMEKVYLEYVETLAQKFPNPQRDFAFLTHTHGCSEEQIKAVYDKAQSIYNFKNLYITVAGSTITSHCGSGTLGLLFINDEPVKL